MKIRYTVTIEESDPSRWYSDNGPDQDALADWIKWDIEEGRNFKETGLVVESVEVVKP